MQRGVPRRTWEHILGPDHKEFLRSVPRICTPALLGRALVRTLVPKLIFDIFYEIPEKRPPRTTFWSEVENASK